MPTIITNMASEPAYVKISPEEAKERLDSGDPLILLDVRTKEENLEQHIPGSLLIPVDILEAEVLEKLPDKEAEILIYCRSGRRSAIAAETLVDLGYTNVKDFGGIIDWPYETVSGE